MTEKYQPIPHRLKNMAVGGHVAGAMDILDDLKDKDQQTINAEVDESINSLNTEMADRYTKSEVNNIISRTPETDVVVLTVPEGSTAADVLDEIPIADRPNKLFRVINDDSTAYSEYGWTGSAWAVLANKDYGIDEEPTPGSDNLVKSGGVASVEGYYVDNPEYIKAELDAEGRIIRAIKNNGDIYFGAGIPSQIKASIDSLDKEKVDKENGNSLINAEYAEGVEYTDNPEYIMAILDAEKRVIFTLDSQKTARVYSRRIATEDDLEALREELIDAMSDYVTPMIINPYEGVDMSNTVLSTTHEHYKTKETLQDAYNRGIRVFAVSDYSPAVPRYPLSNYNYDYLDYKSKEAVDGGDRELITKNFSGSIPVITIDNQDINTDTLPQIANAEHPFVKNQREHFNILGLVWGEPGQQLAGASGTANNSWKRKNAIITPALLNSFLEDESKWQFGSQYVFGTINHTKDFDYVKNALDACPNIFKAMEIFSKGYSRGWNKEFRDTYDSILRHGYRIWGTSVADWPKSYGQWGYTTAEERSEWIAKYNALPEEEKELYEDVADYYYQTAVYKFTRGANCVIVPSNYDSMTPEEKALEVVKSYIAGRYYLVGTGAHTLNVSVNGSMVTFRFSDICLNIRLVTGKEEFTYHDLDTVTYKMKKGDMYVRIEGDWDDGVDGDIVYSNPIWIE